MNRTATRRQVFPGVLRCRGNTVEEPVAGPSRTYSAERDHGIQRARALLVVAAFWLLVGVIVVGALWVF